jgi:3-hydroxyacyl-CoA dehydrogenase, C-terminal domain
MRRPSIPATETIRRAIDFYASIGKKPIHLRKEVVGHVANRLQAALYREVVYLIEQGVLDVADSDTAVCWGPGLRWGVMGPNLLFHLGGGEGGIQHFMEHLAGPMASWWKDLGTPSHRTFSLLRLRPSRNHRPTVEVRLYREGNVKRKQYYCCDVGSGPQGSHRLTALS